MFDDLLAYVRADLRVCPQPIAWGRLWQMLPDNRQVGSDWIPPQPLILGASQAPATMKIACLEGQIRYAADRGLLPQIDAFLRALPVSEWQYLK